MDINLFRLRNLFAPTNPIMDAPVPNMDTNSMDNSGLTLNDLYSPEHAATDQFNNMLGQYPTRTNPSLGRKFGAALLNLGGQDGQAYLDQPFNEQLMDWKNKIAPALSSANLEKSNNSNERLLANNILTNNLNTKKADTAANQGQQRINNEANRVKLMESAQKFKQEHPDWDIKEVDGGNYMFFNPQNPNDKPIDSGIKTGTLSDTDKANLGHKNKMAEINLQGNNTANNAENRGWGIGSIPDPSDPSKQIGVRYNQITGEVKPIEINHQPTLITKAGTNPNPDVTTSTKTMMEGAQMLRPHIADLRKQAAELDRRGLFGPVMSRLRDIGAKVGTTGDASVVQKNLEDFANAVSKDPLLNQNNDAAVGQFLTNIGLMASGAGRVHGGAKGGGSIQMVNAFKALLTSDSTLSMFQGRLNSLDDYMKGYAAGPKGTTKTKLDAVIESILGGGK